MSPKRPATRTTKRPSSARKATLVLAGDIGGTRGRFALVAKDTGKIVFQEVLSSREFDSFDACLEQFFAVATKKLGSRPAIGTATFGIAGPVIDQRVKTTNLPWILDAAEIAKSLGVERVTLLNDLVALGLGALVAPPSKLEVLRRSAPAKKGANVAVIAAGTGLGEAVFVWDGATHVPCSTEGAHVDFAPRSPVEIELWSRLVREYGHVSYERVASASTIHVLYTFFVREQHVKESKANASLVATAPDPNVVIVDLAEKGRSEAAMRAIDLWAAVYGAEAGNLALKSLATGGVFVCGGASVRLAKILASGLPRRKKAPGSVSPFIDAFLDKGRMRPLLEQMPIAVVKEPLAGLYGAARHAVAVASSARSSASS